MASPSHELTTNLFPVRDRQFRSHLDENTTTGQQLQFMRRSRPRWCSEVTATFTTSARWRSGQTNSETGAFFPEASVCHTDQMQLSAIN